MKIKQNYVRKIEPETTKMTEVQKCPNCKADIPKTEWHEHFKICVLDAKWRDNK